MNSSQLNSHPFDPQLLATRAGCISFLHALLESSPDDIARHDIAILNLLCAESLPSAQSLCIPRCLQVLDQLSAFVTRHTERNLYHQPSDRYYAHCEPMWRMAMLVTLVKRDFGASYHPEIRDRILSGDHALSADAADVFVHGLLGSDRHRRWGTCASLPVLIARIARGQGYPVRLAVAGRHIFLVWQDESLQFNIEVSNPQGMTIPTDDELDAKVANTTPAAWRVRDTVRILSPAEEFALFMMIRVECLVACGRMQEAIFWCARALQLAPSDPTYPHIASFVMRQANNEVDQAPIVVTSMDCGDKSNSARALSFRDTIHAHRMESEGNDRQALLFLAQAYIHCPTGSLEQRNLSRLLQKGRRALTTVELDVAPAIHERHTRGASGDLTQ